MLTDEVIEFIHRRFPVDCKWLNGNCYYFALILSDRFDGEIYYQPKDNHFISKIDDRYFDYSGEYKNIDGIIKFEDIISLDENWYKYLIRDCVM